MRNFLFAMGGLLAFSMYSFASPDNAQLDAYVGAWLVVPRAAPDTVSPGGIPRVFRIANQNGTLTGEFEWNGEPFLMRKFKLEKNGFAFELTAKNPDSWLGTNKLTLHAVASPDRQKIEVGEDEGEAPFVARRVTPQQLDAAIQAAPKVGPWKKQPMPPLRDLKPTDLAPTPVLGWNSWNVFREAIDDRTIRATADVIVSSGLRDAGYVYINIDDGWQGQRDAKGVLHPNAKFPDMKALADYVHARGLKLGIYSSPGPVTCAGYLGSHGHEEQDAKTFAEWGIDLLKYDWCMGAMTLYKTQPEMQALYQKMGAALQATGKRIVYSLCQYGLHDVGSWGGKVGGHMWRTGGDSVEGNLWKAVDHRFEHNGNPDHSGPNSWNDADMMLVGLKGLTTEEYRTHFTLWTLSASPIVLGNDLRVMTDSVKEILMNREVIAVDQDALGVQGRRVLKKDAAEVWVKPLADGSKAVALFNRGESAANIEVKPSEVGFTQRVKARDLWKLKDLEPVDGGYRATIPPHGSILLKFSPIK